MAEMHQDVVPIGKSTTERVEDEDEEEDDEGEEEEESDTNDEEIDTDMIDDSTKATLCKGVRLSLLLGSKYAREEWRGVDVRGVERGRRERSGDREKWTEVGMVDRGWGWEQRGEWTLLTVVDTVIRQQVHGTVWRGNTKDDVRKTQNGSAIVPHTQPPSQLIVGRYSSFNGDGYNGYNDSGYNDRGYSDGPERDKRWYDPREDFWWFLPNGQNCLGWGTGAAVFLGLHLKPLSNLLFHDSYPTHHSHPNYALCPSVLLALGSPLPPRSAKHAPQASAAPATDTESEIDKLCAKFTKLYEDYRSRSDNVAAYKCLKRGDHANAVVYWKKACLAGNSKAQFNLGLCYEKGLGVHKNVYKAVKFYEMAVSSEHPLAMYNLACLYLTHTVRPIAGLQGETTESYQRDAITLMERAAECGVCDAQTYLGAHYTNEPHCDMYKAAKLFAQAAAQNNHEAQYMLGVCEERGLGVPQNECRAAHLYSKASLAGHSHATYNLAVMHELGTGGLPENKATAKDLYTKALTQGCAVAQGALDRMALEEKANNDQTNNEQTNKDTSPNPRTNFHSVGSSPSLNSRTSSKNHINRKFSRILDSIKALITLHHPVDKRKATFSIGHPDDDEDVNGLSLSDSPPLTKAASVGCIPDSKVVIW